jgi:hypothetical protein
VKQTSTDRQDFVHPELCREVTAIGGHYVFGKEIRMPYNGRELLYFVGCADLDSTCCGVGGCAYVLVPGFLRQWKYKKNQDDCFISKTDPIRDPSVQKDIRRLIQKKEMVFQVIFG